MSNFRGNFDGYIEELTTTLKAETFEPCPVRRVYIPKPNSEKKRPLGIPILFDRIVQEALRMILEPIWEADFSVHSYGFRPNRSTYDAIAYIGNRLKGNGSSYQWVIEGDIKSYFDTIPHRRLIKAVKKRVADRKIRDLLWKFLRAGVMHRGQFEETLTGTPQGGIVSPLLANIYLDALDKYMESKYLKLSDSQRSRRREQGKSNFLYVRYADDWVVLCNGTKAAAQDMKEELKTLLAHMGLTLSEEKTKLTHITEGFLFLGYKIIREIGTNGHMVPKVLIPESAITKNRHKVRGMLAPHTFKDSVKAKILALNRVTNGWCQYYRVTSYPSAVFNKRRYELFWDMAHWLGRKWERSIPQIIQEYYDPQGNTFRVHTLSMVLPSDHKAKRLLTTTWHNPYTAKDAIIREKLLVYESAWSGQEHRQGRMDLREEAIALKGTICTINGPDCESKGVPLHPSEVHGDHIIARSRFKNPKDADRLGNIQIVCTNCHRTKTQNDLRVLSRMRSKPQVRF